MTSDADTRTAIRALEPAGAAAHQLHFALADGERALSADGDLAASRLSFERAYGLAELAGDVPAMATAALGLCGLWVSERRTVTGAAMLETRLQQVLPQLDPDSALALRIRIRLAAESDYLTGESDRILDALGAARAAAEPVALAEALSLAHHCLLGPNHLALRRELAIELIKVSFRTDRRSDRLMGLLWQTVDCYANGDPHAGRLLGELRDHLSQRDHPAVGFVVSAVEVMLAIRAGQLSQAETLVAICAQNGAAAGDIDSEWWPGAQLVTIRWYQGRLAELRPMLSARVHSPVLSAVDNSAVAALAVAAALDGDSRTAASCLAMLRGQDLARLPHSSSWLGTLNGIVEAAHLLADADVATSAYDLLAPHADLPMVGGLGVTCFGSAHQALGLAALTAQRPDRAVEHLRAAVQHNLALAHWPAVVSSRRRLADACLLRCGPGDRDTAERELRAARSEAAAAGLPGPDGPHPASASTASACLACAEHGGKVADCARAGRNWRVTLADRSVLVEDSIGMAHLAVLIANPRQDISAADLAAGLAVAGRLAAGASQPVLDRRAIGEYRSQLMRLSSEISQLESADALDVAGRDRAARARAEHDWITAQLASAAGLAGRTRAFPDDGERARVAVGKAIRRALARIGDADPVIGEHLRRAVHTGARCSYWPA
jgi:hypothetical protein